MLSRNIMFMLRILLILKLSQNVLTQNLGLKNHQVHEELDLDTNSQKDICGIRKNLSRQHRIVGGKVASYGDWPWQVLNF